MAEGSKAQGPKDPMDFWKQWSETSTKMWSSVLDGGKGTFVDPYGLYQPWLKSIEVAQESNDWGMGKIRRVGRRSVGSYCTVAGDDGREPCQNS